MHVALPLFSESLQDCLSHSPPSVCEGIQKQMWICPLGLVPYWHDSLTEWICSELNLSHDPQYIGLPWCLRQ